MKRITDKHSGKEYRETDCRDWSQGFAFVYVLPIRIADDVKTESIRKIKDNIEKLEGLANKLKNLQKALDDSKPVETRKRRR